MTRGIVPLVCLGVLAAGVAALLALQHERNVGLRFERDAVDEQVRESARLRQENIRLTSQLPSATELESLRSDHAAVVRLRQELDALRAEADKPVAEAPEAPRRIPAAEWRNAGRASPAAAIETLLWAAASGDVNTLASALSFDPKTRPAVDAFYAGMPPSVRAEYPTAELLVASLTLKDVPLGAMTIAGQQQKSPDDAAVAVRLEGPGVPERSTIFSIHRDSDGWRLRVPAVALRLYANALGTPVP